MTQTGSLTKQEHFKYPFLSEDTLARTDDGLQEIIRKGFEFEGFYTRTAVVTNDWCGHLQVFIRDRQGNPYNRDLCTFTSSDKSGNLWEDLSVLVTENSSLTKEDLDITGPSSTIQESDTLEVDLIVKSLFDSYESDDVEDGFDNEFTLQLESLVTRFGNKAISTISNMETNRIDQDQLVAKALSWLGHLEHPQTYYSRLSLLEKNLKNSSRWIRDGSALGLAAMDDKHAIPYLQEAIRIESILDLKQDLKQVLESLEK